MKRVPGLVVLLVSAPALWACGGEADGPREVVVRDSAGVVIVENDPATPVPRWRIDSEPIFEIGGDVGDPSRELYEVRAARRLPDGRIVVANGGTQEIRFYDDEGSLIHAAGGEGEGPGEYQGLFLLDVLGRDSLVAFDFRTRRVSVLGSDGEYARDFVLEIPGGSSFTWARGVTGAEHRSLVVHQGAVFRSGEVQTGVVRDSVTYYLMDPTGEVRDTLGTFADTERWVQSSDGIMMVRTLPFGRSPRLGFGRAGFYESDTDRYDIGYYGFDGRLQRRARLLRESRPVTDEDVEAYRRRALADAGEPVRAMTERILRDIPFPETMPAHDVLHVDDLDHLWVREYAPAHEEGPDLWRIFDPEGRYVAVAELPSGFVIYQIGEDYVLGRWQDDFDLEYVRLLPLEREGGTP